jgi:hypothetical protein
VHPGSDQVELDKGVGQEIRRQRTEDRGQEAGGRRISLKFRVQSSKFQSKSMILADDSVAKSGTGCWRERGKARKGNTAGRGQ